MSHRFEETPDGSCAWCGFVFEFAGLHEPEPPALDYDVPGMDLYPVCRSCWHAPHTGPCRNARPGVGSVACGCEVTAA